MQRDSLRNNLSGTVNVTATCARSQIVKRISGKWCHWFRSKGEAYYVRYVFKEPVKAASALRLRRSDTLIEYVPFNWQDYAKELSA